VTKLERGSFVVFFTDGLLEWNRNIFDAWSHLTEAVADVRIREADHPAHAIRNAIVKSEEHSDDIAVLTLSIS
jgi:serine phosphatase RsbU (regulator of sigma subunit)